MMEIINGKEYYDINEVAADLSISRQGALTKIETFFKVNPDAKQYMIVREGKHANFYCEDLFVKMGLPVGKNSIKRVSEAYEKKLLEIRSKMRESQLETQRAKEEIDRLRNELSQVKADAESKVAEYEQLKEEVIQLRERAKNQEVMIQSKDGELKEQRDTVNQLTAAVGIITATNTKLETAFRSLSATPLMTRLFGWNKSVQSAALLTQDIIQSDAAE